MLGYLFVGALSFIVGLLSQLVVLYIYKRIVYHTEYLLELSKTAADLENRRVAYDSGRADLARAGSGDPAVIFDGMSSKPGVLESFLRDAEATKKIDVPKT